MTAMNPFDLTALIIIVLSTFWGGMRGIISQLGSLAAWGVSLIVSARYYSVFAPLVPVSDNLKTPCGAFVAFVVSFIALSFAARFLKTAVSLAGLKEFDRQAGALLGLGKGVVLCLAITFFFVLASDKTREIIDSSKSGAFFVAVVSEVQSAFPDSELKAKFAEISATLKKTNENETVEDEIDSLKKYLTTHVFTTTAAEVVKEADKEEKAEESGSAQEKSASLFQRFADGMRALNKEVEEQVGRTTPNAALDVSAPKSDASSASNYAQSARNDSGAVNYFASNASNFAQASNGGYDGAGYSALSASNFAQSSRNDSDAVNYSASSANATLENSTENDANDPTGFKRFWDSLGASVALPVVSSVEPTRQTREPQATNSSATLDYRAQDGAENDDNSTPAVSYGAYRTQSSASSSRLRSYRYSIVGPSNY